VSILIAADAGVGRCFGSQPRVKVSMINMRPSQQGHARGSMRGSPRSHTLRRAAKVLQPVMNRLPLTAALVAARYQRRTGQGADGWNSAQLAVQRS
jgi:hypothetical protein